MRKAKAGFKQLYGGGSVVFQAPALCRRGIIVCVAIALQEQKPMQALFSTLSPYMDRRMIWILMIGTLSGYPWALFGTLITLRLQDAGVSRGEIGLFGLVGLAYALNLLWAPLVDAFRLPVPARIESLKGHRKSWILLCQLGVLVLTACLAAVPTEGGWLPVLAGICVLMALLGATQDVAVDALRIELIGREEDEKIAPAAAMATTGWWLGYSGLGALLVFATNGFSDLGMAEPARWALYLAVPLGAVTLLAVAILVPEKLHPHGSGGPGNTSGLSITTWFAEQAWRVYGSPVREFLRRYGWQLALLLLSVIFLFKMGEAFLGRMSIVFYRELGLAYGDIGWGKLASTLTICVSAVIGSSLSVRWGTHKGLLISGVLMAATNLLFAQLANMGPHTGFFLFAVVADQVTSAIATVAFVAFISQLCQRQYAASQYAALASLGNLSRTTLAAGSGYLVTGLGGDWALFFVLTALMVLPSLLLLLVARGPLLRALQRPE